MTTLREAAQQALEALLTPSGAQACSTCQEGPENEYCYRREMWSAITALRAALAQQADTTDPGHDVDVLREHVRHLERRVRELHAQQAEPQSLRRASRPIDEGELWSWVRSVMSQGADIRFDYEQGVHKGYEAYSARLDAAAAERAEELAARLKTPNVGIEPRPR